MRNEIQRDKNGLLPVEAKAASERGPLGMADVRTALETGDCGLGQMKAVVQQLMLGYREGELESWEDYSLPGEDGSILRANTDKDMLMSNTLEYVNGTEAAGPDGNKQIDDGDDWGWEGVSSTDANNLDALLDSCLEVEA